MRTCDALHSQEIENRAATSVHTMFLMMVSSRVLPSSQCSAADLSGLFGAPVTGYRLLCVCFPRSFVCVWCVCARGFCVPVCVCVAFVLLVWVASNAMLPSPFGLFGLLAVGAWLVYMRVSWCGGRCLVSPLVPSSRCLRAVARAVVLFCLSAASPSFGLSSVSPSFPGVSAGLARA